jgi:hypothetical protein
MGSAMLTALLLQAIQIGLPDTTRVRLVVAGGGGIVGDVSVAIRLECSCSAPNSGVFINTAFEAHPREQPNTVVTLTILDTAGREVPPGPEAAHQLDLARWRPVDLSLLRCGAQYGQIVPLRLEWHRVLPAGRYRVRARLESRVGHYFQSHPGERTRLLKTLNLTPAEADALQDFTAVADETTIEVAER